MKKDVIASLIFLLTFISTGTVVNEAEHYESNYDYETKIVTINESNGIEIPTFEKIDLLSVDTINKSKISLIDANNLFLKENVSISLNTKNKDYEDDVIVSLTKNDSIDDIVKKNEELDKNITNVSTPSQNNKQDCSDKNIESQKPNTVPNNHVQETISASNKNNNSNNINKQESNPQDPVSPVQPQKPTITKPVCVTHDLCLNSTKIINSYQLYNYVSDNYKCKNCNYSESIDHRSMSNVSQSTIRNAENDVVKYVNQLRTESGLSELWVRNDWNAWARNRAESISKNYSHIGWTNAIDNTYTLAENIASGQASGLDFYNAFLSSSSHKGAMIKSNAVGIAVGIYVDLNGQSYCAMSIIAEK